MGGSTVLEGLILHITYCTLYLYSPIAMMIPNPQKRAVWVVCFNSEFNFI